MIIKRIKAGVTNKISVNASAHDISGASSLVLYFRGASSLDVSANNDNGNFLFLISAEESGSLPPGDYAYTIRASYDDGSVVEIESGSVVVHPDITKLDANHDSRNHAKKVLDAIEAVIEKRATLDQKQYRINDRELERTPIADLLLLRDRYRSELAIQKAAKDGKLFNSIPCVFR